MHRCEAPVTASLPSGCLDWVGALFPEATPGTLSADMIRKLRTPPRRTAALTGAARSIIDTVRSVSRAASRTLREVRQRTLRLPQADLRDLGELR